MIEKEIFDKDNVPSLVIDEGNALEGIQQLIDIIKSSDEFKRLADCTQVVFNDNKKNANMVQNRQSHTLLVAEVSYKLAKKFNLSELDCKVAELIGLCHDLGHVAFGHDGENRIDEALKNFGITAQEYNDAYLRTNKVDSAIGKKFGEMKHAFEHHAQSARVLRKILKDKNIFIKDQDLFDKIELGILAHSESRAQKMKIPHEVSAITRYADKFYIFTDILDIIKATEDGVGLDAIKRIIEKSTSNELDNKEEMIEFVAQVFGEFINLQEGALEEYEEQYISECEIGESEDGWRVTPKADMAQKLKVLKDLVKKVRVQDSMTKEELLAKAMIDEVILYRVEHAEKGEDGKFVKSENERVIDACLFVGEMEDTELRTIYRSISKDKEWVEKYRDYAIGRRKGKTGIDQFPIVLDEEDILVLRENPDIILTHYFKSEINKVQDSDAKKRLVQLYTRYKKADIKTARRLKKELIEMIAHINGVGNSSGPDR